MSIVMSILAMIFGLQYYYFGNTAAGVFALLFLFSALSLRKDRHVV